MEETAIHGAAVECAECASVGIRVGWLRGRGSAMIWRKREAISSRASSQEMRTKASWALGTGAARAFWLELSAHGIQHAVGRVDAVEILGNFGAEESAGDGVSGIALNFGGAAIFDGNENAAGIGTIVRAGGVDYALHVVIIKLGFLHHGGTETRRKP